LKSDFEQSKW